jgi:hypothetical protein
MINFIKYLKINYLYHIEKMLHLLSSKLPRLIEAGIKCPVGGADDWI